MLAETDKAGGTGGWAARADTKARGEATNVKGVAIVSQKNRARITGRGEKEGRPASGGGGPRLNSR